MVRVALKKSGSSSDRKNGFEVQVALQLAKLEVAFSV